MSTTVVPKCAHATCQIVAAHLRQEIGLNAAHPSPLWSQAESITFCWDWRGENPDPARETQVRIMWSRKTLYLRFECRYRELFTFDDSTAKEGCDHLWDRDVAEVFLQPDPSQPNHYKEFEISPNGMWIDLDIFPGGRAALNSGLRHSTFLDDARQVWAAELAIPIESLTPNFDSSAEWRVNFFRVEGSIEPRTYQAWLPTRTPQPNFHVSEVFGRLHFAAALG